MFNLKRFDTQPACLMLIASADRLTRSAFALGSSLLRMPVPVNTARYTFASGESASAPLGR
jgi:hypothetical protein